MSQPRRTDGSVLPNAAVCDVHYCHPVKPASINGDAKAPDGVEIHQRRGNANGRVKTKKEDEYCRFKFNSADGDDLYLVFAVATAWLSGVQTSSRPRSSPHYGLWQVYLFARQLTA